MSARMFAMKKIITLALLAALASPCFVGCKSCLSGTNCFTRTGSRIPLTSSSSDYADSDSALASNAASPRVVNAAGSGEVVMMNTTSAYSQCAPCAPTACNPCDPCTPCDSANGGASNSGYPAGSYAGL